jgi:protease-4
MNPVAVERGAHSGLFEVSRRLKDDERQVIGGQVEAIYGEFKDRVVEGRGFELEKLEKLAGGRVWTGAEAYDYGLIDEIGGWRTALDKARELAGIEADAPEVVVKISPPKTGRPMPENASEAIRWMFEDYKDAGTELRAAKVWALAPYTFSED